MSLQLKNGVTPGMKHHNCLFPRKIALFWGKNIAAMKIWVAGISIIVYKSAKKICKFYLSFCKKAVSRMFQNFKFNAPNSHLSLM